MGNQSEVIDYKESFPALGTDREGELIKESNKRH